MRLFFLTLVALVAGGTPFTTLNAQTVDAHQAMLSQEQSASTPIRHSRIFDSYRNGMRTTTIVRVQEAIVSTPATQRVISIDSIARKSSTASQRIRTVQFNSPDEFNLPEPNRLASTNNPSDNARMWRPKPYLSAPSQRPVRDLIYKQPQVDLSVWQDGGDRFSGFGVDSLFNSSSSCNEWKSFCQIKNGHYLNPCFALRPGDGDCCIENCGGFSRRNRPRVNGRRTKDQRDCQECRSQ